MVGTVVALLGSVDRAVAAERAVGARRRAGRCTRVVVGPAGAAGRGGEIVRAVQPQSHTSPPVCRPSPQRGGRTATRCSSAHSASAGSSTPSGGGWRRRWQSRTCSPTGRDRGCCESRVRQSQLLFSWQLLWPLPSVLGVNVSNELLGVRGQIVEVCASGRIASPCRVERATLWSASRAVRRRRAPCPAGADGRRRDRSPGRR